MQRIFFPSCFILLSLGPVGCQSGPSTSSSSNWFTCEVDADCAEAPRAVSCERGYCVDDEGARILRVANSGGSSSMDGTGGSDSGGSSGGSATGGAATGGGSTDGGATGDGGSPSDGGTGSNTGGSDSGGSGMGGEATGGAMLGEPSCDDLGTWAACSTDDDCTNGPIMTSCCGSMGLRGVNVDHAQDFSDLAAVCDSMWPACGCAALPYPELDDGRYLMEGEAVVACVEGKCRTMVGQRTCGEVETCDTGEICLQVETVVGPQGGYDFSCVPNPCGESALSCDCAADLCDVEDGAVRTCVAPTTTQADVFCQDMRQ